MLKRLILAIILLSETLSPQASDYYSLAAVKRRFADAWNAFVISEQRGVLDLRLRKQVNKRWQDFYQHDEWTK